MPDSEAKKKAQKKYREANREKLREKGKEKDKKYREANREKLRERQTEYMRKRRASDPLFKLTGNIRKSVLRVLNQKQSTKTKHTHKYLGCSMEFFTTEYWPSKIRAWNQMYPEHKLDLESNDIDIDHIKPVRAFEENEMHECFNFRNLQPLPKAINNLKSDTWCFQDECYWRCNIISNDQHINPYLPVEMDKGWHSGHVSLIKVLS